MILKCGMVASHRFSLLACLLLSASACKGGGDPVQEICELSLSCECSVAPYATVEACVTDINQKNEDLKTYAAGRGLSFNQGCLDRSYEVTHDQLGCALEFPDQGGSCSPCSVVHGDAPVGAACNSDGGFSECALDLFCDDNVCIDPCARLAAGVACAAIDGGQFKSLGICADDLYCNATGDKTCTASQDAGTACIDFNACKQGLYCDIGGTGNCLALPAKGEACTGSCAGGLQCNGAICEDYPGEGEACMGLCADGFDCDNDVCVASEPLLCLILNDN